jgi:hypothetical protein
MDHLFYCRFKESVNRNITLICVRSELAVAHDKPVDHDHRTTKVKLAEWCFSTGGWI